MKSSPLFPALRLPFWMNGEPPQQAAKREPYYLARGVAAFWHRVWHWLAWPLQQLDPLTCSESLLDLLAWERDINRFEREPLERYRRRVKYAFANARDAGEAAGFMRIFQRLGAPVLGQQERVPDIDWDIILLELSPTSTTEDARLMSQIIQQYGRTCRRYEFVINQVSPAIVAVGEFNHDWQTVYAQAHITLEDTNTADFMNGTTEFNFDNTTVTAHGRNH